VLPTGAGPAVQLIYNDEKKGPFSLYVARAPDCLRAKPRYTRDGDLSLMSWCRNRAVFMLIGKLDRTAMNWIVDAVNQPDAAAPDSAEDESAQTGNDTHEAAQTGNQAPALERAVIKDER
jgi:hypothetical protein